MLHCIFTVVSKQIDERFSKYFYALEFLTTLVTHVLAY